MIEIFLCLYMIIHTTNRKLLTIFYEIFTEVVSVQNLRKPIKIRLFLSRNYINNTDEIFGYMIKHDAKIEF